MVGWTCMPSGELAGPEIEKVTGQGYELAYHLRDVRHPQNPYKELTVIARVPGVPPREDRYFPGALVLRIHGQAMEGVQVNTEPDHQRRGLATALYVVALHMFPECTLRPGGPREAAVVRLYEKLAALFPTRVSRSA